VFRVLCSVTLTALLAFPATAQTNPNPGSAQLGSVPTTLVGCVQKTGDVYTLTDETSKTTAQLRGGNLRKGRHVQVTGTPSANASPAGGATEVLDVTGVKSVGGSCRATPGSAGSSYVAGGTKRGTVVSVFIMVTLVTLGAIAVISRQGEARGGGSK
jgi:hypothetical protein